MKKGFFYGDNNPDEHQVISTAAGIQLHSGL